MKLKFLSENGGALTKGSTNSAGWDLYSADKVTIKGGYRTVVKTDIAIEIPKGCYGRIAPRSSMSKNYIDVCAGVIDCDYRGNIGIMLHNHKPSGLPYEVNIGDRIAQIIFEKYDDTIEIEVCQNLSTTERDTGGYGSTGK